MGECNTDAPLAAEGSMVPSGTPGSFIAAMRQCRSDRQRQHISAAYPWNTLPWQHIDAMRPRAAGRGNISTPCVPEGAGRGNISPWCVFGRSPMAKCSRNAFPSVRQWQDIAAVRFRGGSSRGEISPRCVPGRRSVAAFSLHAFPKGPRTGKAPLPGSISPPCIRNEPASARYSRHASEKRRKQPSENTPREDLATKGPFSLHGPLRSCTARGSCRRSALERKKIGQSQKIAGVSTRTRSKVVTSY